MLTILLLTAALAAAPDEVLARVGPDVVTASQLTRRIDMTRFSGGNARPEDLLQDLIHEALLAREGARLGLEHDPAVVQKVEAERRHLAGQRFVEKEVESAAAVNDTQLAQMYHLSADTVHLDEVVLATQAEAAACLERLRSGAKLADEASRSLDPAGAAAHGDLGLRSRGQLDPQLEEAAFHGPLGAFEGPVQLAVGWAVVRFRDRSVGDETGFRARQAQLRRFAEAQGRSQYRRHYLTQLRKKAGARIDEPFLKTTGTRVDGSPAEAEHVVASVDGTPIRYREVTAELRRLYNGAEGGHVSGLAVKSEIAWNLVDRALLESEATSRGYGSDRAVATALQQYRRDEVVRALTAKLRAAVGPPSEEEIAGYYRAHLPDFTLPAHQHCAHILVDDRGLAEGLRQRLARGEPFEDLARDYSKDSTSAASGGLLGDLTDERIAAVAMAGEPGLAAALRDSKPDQVAGPVKSRAGWHLVRCSARMPAVTAPLAEVRERLVPRLDAERGNDTVRRRIAELQSQVKISIDAAAVTRAAASAGNRRS